MKIRLSTGEKTFAIVNYTFLTLLALLCILPFLHMLAISFSSSAAATAGRVGLWPVDFTTASYQYAIQKREFIAAFLVTIRRTLLGVTIDLAVLILTAYPLSKSNRELPGRTAISWIFVITMFVSGGLIPTYLVVSGTHLKNTIWALIIPGVVKAYYITILLNFFRQIPKELEESAVMDGASQIRVLLSIYLPLSLPALATLTIFDTVGHWNEWFSGMIYMSSQIKYPLQTFLRGIIVAPNYDLMDRTQMELMAKISSKTFQAAQIIIATVPILAVYPFMQKYFISGMMLGSLKG
ncbi:MAG: carbohydrate ABC transporter permease [Clostridiales bacterium]|jgi:putative aldouronate transport system permease protein|nr:carbohydrate ABC transporter permease [Clostridiales bacterium]